MTSEHEHPTGPDLWRVLEFLVWLSVGVLVVIGVEWIGGYIVRERIAAGAQKHLAKVSDESSD